MDVLEISPRLYKSMFVYNHNTFEILFLSMKNFVVLYGSVISLKQLHDYHECCSAVVYYLLLHIAFYSKSVL